MYIIVAIISYFIGAVVVVFDKFLLASKKIPAPSVYAFYIGLMGLFSLVLFPFGFFVPSGYLIFVSLAGGAIFIYGIFFLYCAINSGEASRVAPLVGAVLGLCASIISLIFGETLNYYQLGGIFLLVMGGIVISLSGSTRSPFKGVGWAITSGVLMAIAFFIFKYVYDSQNFINGFIWTRFGLTLGALTFLLVPSWRKEILDSLDNFGQNKRRGIWSLALLVFNKTLGGISSILTNWAVAIGSVAIVSALAPIQYAFVFLIASLVSLKKPDIFREELNSRTILAKTLSILIIGIGLVLISLGDVRFGLI